MIVIIILPFAFEMSLIVLQSSSALGNDFIVKSHLADLYDTLLEGNLSKIIEPFSVVEINHIAELIDLPPKAVELKSASFHGALFSLFFKKHNFFALSLGSPR